MLFDSLAACFSPLVPEDLRNIWITRGETICGRHTGANSKPSSDSHLRASRRKGVMPMDSVNVNLLRPLGPYMLSMNRKIAPLASHSEPETLPLDAAPRKFSLKRKDDGFFLDGKILLDVKKRRVAPKSPRNSRDAYSDTLSSENSPYEHDVDRVEVTKKPTDLMDSLLIKKRGNVRFQLPKAETKAVQTKRSLIDLPGQKDFRTLALYNSAFAMTGSLPRVKSPLGLYEISDRSWDNSDGNEDSCQSTLVPTPSGSIDYTPGKPNVWNDYDRSSSSSAGVSELLLNPVLVPESYPDKPRRNIESGDSSDITSGSDAYSGSEEEEQSRATISSEEEVERQLKVISDSESSEGYRKTVVYKGSGSVARCVNVIQTNGRTVELTSGTHRIRDRSPGECIHSLLRSEDGTCSLLKVSVKTLLEIGNGSFQGTLLKPKMTYRGKEISFLRKV